MAFRFSRSLCGMRLSGIPRQFSLRQSFEAFCDSGLTFRFLNNPGCRFPALICVFRRM